MEKRQKKIIVPIDGSSSSLKAMKVGGIFAANHGAELVLLHVVEPVPNFFLEDDGLEEKRRAWGIRLLDSAKKAYKGPDCSISEMIVSGKPYKAIVEAAEEIMAEMIVIGTWGKHAAGSGLVGSNVQKIVRTSRVPVVTVPEAPESDQFAKVLLPVDPSFGAIELEKFLYSYHKVYSPVVELVSVCARDSEVESTKAYLEKQVNMLTKAGLKDISYTLLRNEDPAAEILRYREEGGHDIIWMETHGRKGLASWFYGSVTEEILNNAPVPVLTIHPEREPDRTYYYHSNLPI